MHNKTKQIFAASLVALALVGMNCSNSNDGGGSSSVAVTGVTLDKTSEVIDVDGGSTTLKATIAPSNASNTDVTWKSSDDTVATVDPNGTVTAVKVGTATITVTTNDGGFTASATITVSVAVTFKTVVAGEYHTLAISTDDKLYAWGSNYYGQLGDGSTDNHNTPKEIMAGIKTVVVSGNPDRRYALAINTDGKLYAWGENTPYGQLGDGTTTNRSTSTEIKVSGTTFKTVVAGGYHTLAISTDDKLYAWGGNGEGQLGDGSTTYGKGTPQEITVAGTTFQTVVATGSSSYAISTDDKLYAWGNNRYGQLGNGKAGSDEKEVTPQEIMAGTTFQTVVANGSHTLAINTAGELFAWGYNKYGQLGDGTTTNKKIPTEIMAGIKTVVAGKYHTLAISSDGKLYTWGKNNDGQLGDGTTNNSSTPKEIMAGIKTVVAGNKHTLAISTAGKLYAWGNNNGGQLGDGKGGWGEKEVTPQLIEVYE